MTTDCLIIGSGPAGYTAAIYAQRAGINTIIAAGPVVGGQLTTTHEIENYPGFPDAITGFDLMEKMKQQAEKFGTTIIYETISKVNFSNRPFTVETDAGKSITAQTVIIATGATAKYLGLEAEKKYAGMGVSACAVCDGFFYRNQDVIIVGGGDTAVGDALYLSKICRTVYLAVRKDYLRASSILQQRLTETENIKVLYKHEVTDIFGNNGVEGVTLKYRDNNNQELYKNLNVTGYFVAIGRTPQTEVFTPYINTDQNGYIITAPGSTRTNIDGVFACGDCADPVFRQAVVAAGTGCKAALEVENMMLQSNKH